MGKMSKLEKLVVDHGQIKVATTFSEKEDEMSAYISLDFNCDEVGDAFAVFELRSDFMEKDMLGWVFSVDVDILREIIALADRRREEQDE